MMLASLALRPASAPADMYHGRLDAAVCFELCVKESSLLQVNPCVISTGEQVHKSVAQCAHATEHAVKQAAGADKERRAPARCEATRGW